MSQTNIVLAPGLKSVSFDEASNTLTIPPSLEIMCNHMLLEGEGGREVADFIEHVDKNNREEKKYLLYGERVDPVLVVELDPIGFEAFLNFELRSELTAFEKEKWNWAIFLDQGSRSLGEIYLTPSIDGTCTIACRCSETKINITREAHILAYEYWAQPDAELINLPHEWSSYDHAYMMRNWLMEDLRKAGVLAD